MLEPDSSLFKSGLEIFLDVFVCDVDNCLRSQTRLDGHVDVQLVEVIVKIAEKALDLFLLVRPVPVLQDISQVRLREIVIAVVTQEGSKVRSEVYFGARLQSLCYLVDEIHDLDRLVSFSIG